MTRTRHQVSVCRPLLGGRRAPATMTLMSEQTVWHPSGEWDDIVYATTDDGIAKITINRPEVHNAFRPQTLVEVDRALMAAREDE